MTRIGASLAVVGCLVAAQANADTVLEFEQLLEGHNYFTAPAYAESGYRLSMAYGEHRASDLLGRHGEEAVHLEVCCGPFTSTMFIQKDDFSAFRAGSFDVLGNPVQRYFFDLTDRFGNTASEAQDVAIQIEANGFLGGAMVATEMFSASVTTFNLSQAFGNIDALQLSVTGGQTSTLPQDAQWDLSDVHLDIDNVTVGSAVQLASAPLPAGLVLLLSALGGVGLTRFRRKA